MKNFVKRIYHTIKRIARVIPNLSKVNGVVQSESYYPELPRKSKMKRRLENAVWVLKNDEVNIFYNLYGLDVKGNNKAKEYLPYNYFMRTRDERNLGLEVNYNYVVLLRDKYLFEKFLNSFGIKTANTIAVIKNGKIFDKDLDNEISEDRIFINGKKRFIKSVDGECADGVTAVSGLKDYLSIKKKYKNGLFIVQEQLVQHPEMNKLNPKSINTLRIITVNNSDNIEILSVVQRVGVRKSGDVDNWAAGGFDVEVDRETGVFKGDGFYKPGHGTRVSVHPETDVLLNGFKVPLWGDVVELVKKAHSKMYGIHSIGWDVAITIDGPVLVEGNDNYEISLMQVNGGLREEWEKAIS